MAESVLLRFLEKGLVDVKGDDSKFEKLQDTSSEVASLLKATPAKTVAYSLVAFDAQAAGDDPAVLEVLGVLKSKWATYVNTFASTPMIVIRAILLDALVAAAVDDERVAVGFAACARNVLPFTETGNEDSIWLEVVKEIEILVDRRAEAEWETPESIDIAPLKLSAMPAVKVSNKSQAIPRDEFKQEMRNSLTSQSGYNVYNNISAWTQEVGGNLGDTLADALDKIAVNAKIEPIDLGPTLKALTSAVSTFVNDAMFAFGGATRGLERRTNLIWWKQALFSQSIQASYRDLPSSDAAALMAFDLYSQIPTFSPASVSAFLSETVNSVSVQAQKSSLKSRMTDALDSIYLAALRQEGARLYGGAQGRAPLLALLSDESRLKRVTDEEFRAITGVEAGLELTDSQFAAWLFRELQAGRATVEPSKKKSAKGTA